MSAGTGMRAGIDATSTPDPQENSTMAQIPEISRVFPELCKRGFSCLSAEAAGNQSTPNPEGFLAVENAGWRELGAHPPHPSPTRSLRGKSNFIKVSFY